MIVNGTRSTPSQVLSGVPQGSVIGPLLFLVFIGDIDEFVKNSFLSSFADDTRVAKGIGSIHDVSQLQLDLNQIYAWAELNSMAFNDKKFEILRYGKNSALKEGTVYVSNTGKNIEEKVHVRDLGVIMSNTANFKDHINHVTKSSSQLASWILRTFESRNVDVMLTLWKSIVLPIYSITAPNCIIHIELGKFSS